MAGTKFLEEGPHGLTSIDMWDSRSMRFHDFRADISPGPLDTLTLSIDATDAQGFRKAVCDAWLPKDADKEAASAWLLDMAVLYYS
jgi:hypothetical protein